MGMSEGGALLMVVQVQEIPGKRRLVACLLLILGRALKLFKYGKLQDSTQ